jgi:acetyl esterase/lipase
LDPPLQLYQSTLAAVAFTDPIITPQGSHAYALRFLEEDADLTEPLASPIYADLRDLPPVPIQCGTAEVLLDDSLRLARRLRDSGGVVHLDVWLARDDPHLPVLRVPHPRIASRSRLRHRVHRYLVDDHSQRPPMNDENRNHSREVAPMRCFCVLRRTRTESASVLRDGPSQR